MTFSRISIEKVFNRDTGKDEFASSIFSKINDSDDYVRLRRELKIRNNQHNSMYVCSECGTELDLSCIPDGTGGHTFYFKHVRDPLFVNCSIKTDSNLSQEEILKKQYAFKSESNVHINLKQKVGEIIRKFIYPEVIIDKRFINDRFGDKEKRKPDIYFKLDQSEITIEFQVNNTFHSIIQEREAFYERNKISLIWVFGEFNPESFQSITIKDIYIPNGNNAFVFDFEAEQASYSQQTLCLKVFYKKYSIKNDLVIYNWEYEIIPITNIKFNSITLRPFHFDSIADKERTEKELVIIQRNLAFELMNTEASKKAKDIKDFLTRFRNNDHTHALQYIEKINNLSEFEIEKLNQELNLNRTFKEGNNVLQVLLKEGGHLGLINFLLRTSDIIELSLFSVNNKNETTLISVLDSVGHPTYTLHLLFSKKYKLCKWDEIYIKSHFNAIEQKRFLYIFEAYEKIIDYDQISYFYENLNKFLVIESAKLGKLSILGNENQRLIWMANLAAEKYQKHWLYFDRAFSFYRIYDQLISEDKNGTFKRNIALLSKLIHTKDPEFEEVLNILYPELLSILA